MLDKNSFGMGKDTANEVLDFVDKGSTAKPKDAAEKVRPNIQQDAVLSRGQLLAVQVYFEPWLATTKD